jgi:integrase/recombinase XerD
MKTWPDRNGSAIRRFVQQRRLHDPSTPTTYRRVLRGFQDAVERGERSPSRVSRRTLETWLHECSAEWAPSTVFHNAGIVDRFLDCLVKEELIVSNPIKDLQAKYHLRGTQTVWRALLAPKPDQELAALRQLPRFGSVLGGLMRDHIAMMRARGYRYDSQEGTLLRFDRFLQRHPELAKEPLQVNLQRWAAARSTAFHAAECERLGRCLAKARHHLDPSVPTLKPDRRPQQQAARQWRRPYIYNSEEVRRLLDIARAYPSPRGPLRPLALYTMLVVGYCAGLRVGEIARLNLGDVDLQAGTITIRKTKFFKSRILPLARTVVAALREYVDERRRAGGSEDPQSALFWQQQGRQRYGIQAIDRLFADILRQAGLKPLRGRKGPRFHDLRHSMVVNRILMWYRAGINPQNRLPFLATYLGHRDINSTLVYITVTQDLLQEAGERFRVLGARCLQAAEGVQP